MISSAPLVSVLMTCYNREKFIAEAIESVLASTYTNFELIIVDDCSADKTVEIARSYAKKDKKIRLFVNEKNLGQFPNRNKAAGYATGEFLMSADSDDTIFPDGIETCVNAMLTFPQSSFGMFCLTTRCPPFIIESKKAIRQHFFEKYFLTVGPGGTIIRRNFFNRINKYPEIYGVPGDMYFNLKAICFSPVVMLPFEFMFYRRHEDQEINNSYSYLINNYQYLKDALKLLPLQLEQKQIDWLCKKNNRKFFVNITRYLFKTRNLLKTKEALQQTQFSWREALTGIFH